MRTNRTTKEKSLCKQAVNRNNSIRVYALLHILFYLIPFSGCAVHRYSNLNSNYRWEIQHKIPLKAFKETTVLRYSHDGKWLAAADPSMTYLIDTESGIIQKTIWAPDSQALAFSSDSTLFAYGGDTPLTIVHEYQSDNLVFKLDKPASTLHLYDIAKAQYVRGFETRAPIYAIAFKGRYGLYSGSENRIHEWGLSSHDQIRQMNIQSDKMDYVYTSVVKDMTTNSRALVFSSLSTSGTFGLLMSGNLLLAPFGYRPDMLSIWDMNHGKVIETIKHSCTPGIGHSVLSADGGRVAYEINESGKIIVKTIGRWASKTLSSQEKNITHFSFSSDGKTLAALYEAEDGSVLRVWDAVNGKCLWQKVFNYPKLSAVAIRPDGVIAVGTSTGNVWIGRLMDIRLEDSAK